MRAAPDKAKTRTKRQPKEPIKDGANETVPVRLTPKDGGDDPDNTLKTPVDLAMDAVYAMTSMPYNAESSTEAVVSTPVTIGERRGLLPRSSLGPSATPSTGTEKTLTETPASAKAESGAGSRGEGHQDNNLYCHKMWNPFPLQIPSYPKDKATHLPLPFLGPRSSLTKAGSENRNRSAYTSARF